MPKKIHLSIQQPCHENWDKMTQVEKGRFCGSCQKQVVDFTGMSDAQLVAFFRKKTNASVCGRFMPDQLNKAMDIPNKRIPWVKYFFQFTLPLFLASLKSSAQKGEQTPIQVEANAECVPDTLPQNIHLVGDTLYTVIDTVDTSAIDTVDTSFIEPLLWKKEIEEFKIKDMQIWDSEVLITGFTVVSHGNPGDWDDCTPSRGVILSDPWIRPYPNPLAPGAPVNIEFEGLPEDFYSVQILTQSGQPVFQKEIWIDKEAKVLSLPLPKISAGMYFMVLTSRERKKRFTEKLIIL